MKYVLKHVKVAIAFINISWKNSIEYMNDFLVLCVDFLVTMTSTIIFWQFLLGDYGKLGNWSMTSLILIGIFGNASWAIGELFAGAWKLSEKITEGRMDKYICRPVNTLFSLILEDMQVEELLKGTISMFILIVWYEIKFDVPINIVDLFLSIVSLLVGIVIIAIIRCIYSCSAFWVESTEGLNILIHMEDLELDRYPLDIFNKATRFILISVVPVSFVSYFPAMFYLHMFNKRFLFLFLESIVMLGLVMLLQLIWRKGIKKYEATGG